MTYCPNDLLPYFPHCPPQDKCPFNHIPAPIVVIHVIIKKIKNSIFMAMEINDKNFQNTVLNTDKPVVLDFWAEWCGPCRIIGPVIEELAKEYEGKAVIGKVDVDQNPEISMEYGIRSIPTLLFFKDGKLVDRAVGVMSKTQIIQRIEDLLKAKVA
jgi:thioredoxin 1